MKTTISFNLPEEREELNDALNGSKYKARIDTLYDDVFRPHLKYDNPILEENQCKMQELSEEQREAIEKLGVKAGEKIPGDMVDLREAVIRLMFEVENGQ